MSDEFAPTENTPASDSPKVEVRTTADGSLTLYVPALDEHYHSTHGARQESSHVFIKFGLRAVLVKWQPLKVLEVGLGTGLNALLTMDTARTTRAYITYHGYETYPLPPEAVAALRPPETLEGRRSDFDYLHATPWNQPRAYSHCFELTKFLQPIQEASLPAAFYNVIYFDAFAPEKQPELWTEDIFAKLYAAAAPGAVLVSYCAQGQFRRNLRAVGWLTEKLPGPPGKREMTRARKPIASSSADF